MTLSQIYQFVEIVKSESISKAADKLYMSQPNLSQSIKKLEKETGITLLERNSTGVNLTIDGYYCYELCKNIIENVEKFENYKSSKGPISPEEYGKTIHFPIATVNYFFLIEAVSAFKKKYEGINAEVEIKEAAGTLVLDLVENETVSFGLCTIYPFGEYRKKKQLKNRRLLYEPLGPTKCGIFVSKDDERFSENEYVNIEKLKEMTMFIMNPGEITYAEVVQYLQRQNIDFKCAAISKSSSFNYMLEALNEFNGFVLGTYSPNVRNSRRNIKFIPFNPDEIEPAKIVAVSKELKPLSPDELELIDIMKGIVEITNV